MLNARAFYLFKKRNENVMLTTLTIIFGAVYVYYLGKRAGRKEAENEYKRLERYNKKL